MGTFIIVVLIIGGLGAWLYFKVPRFKQFVHRILKGGISTSGVPTQKQLDALDEVLKKEQAKTKSLEDKAKLADTQREKQKTIQQEHLKQQQALLKIKGGQK